MFSKNHKNNSAYILLITLFIIFLIAIIHINAASSSIIQTINYGQDESCPICMNGGVCSYNSSSSNNTQCQCTNGWTQNDCSELNCVNSASSTPNITTNQCECLPGWGGVECLQCLNSSVCPGFNSAGSNATCSTDLITYSQKYFTCEVSNPSYATLMGSLFTFSCSNATEVTPGVCQLQVWDTRFTQKVENFYCTFSGCSFYTQQETNGDTSIYYQCTNTNCNCTFYSDLCTSHQSFSQAYLLYQTIAAMKTTATVQCNAETYACTLDQNELQKMLDMVIPVQCTAGECLSHYMPIPPPKPAPKNNLGMYAGIVFGSSVLILLLALAGCSVLSAYQTRRMGSLYRELQKNPSHGSSLTFKNLSYTLPVGKIGCTKQKKLLNKVSHHIKSGEIVAIMGPSGAGKTTLLDILAHRRKRGTVSGDVFIDGAKADASFKRKSGYVFQDDILMGTLTVRECLMFAANMRLPDAVSQKDKKKKVQEIMEELGISHISEVKVGNEMSRGISGGEKRRLSIGMELIFSPSILFLDEPTSGLDSFNAFSVIQSLSRLSKNGRTIVFSIHQPSSSIFELFDQLILVANGKIAYAGPAKESIKNFESQGYSFPSNFNPADVLIDIVTNLEKENKKFTFSKRMMDEDKESNKLLPSDHLNREIEDDIEENEDKIETMQYQKVAPSSNSLHNVNQSGIRQIEDEEYYYKTSENKKERGYGTVYGSDPVEKNPPKLQLSSSGEYLNRTLVYSTSFSSQFFTLSGRAFKNFSRNFFLMPSHYASAVILGALLGWVFFQSHLDLSGIQNRLGAIFFMFGVLSFGAMVSLEIFISERALYVRERANGYFYPAAYFLSKCLFDIIPLRLFPPIIMGSIMYWMIGLRPEWIHFGYFLLIMVLFNFSASSLCLAVGAIAPSVASGNFFCIILILFFMLFGGFFLSITTLPVYLSWIRYTSIFFYGFEALAINELYNVQILINPPEKVIQPYLGTGSFILELFGLHHERFYLDVVMMFVLSIAYITLAALLLKFFVKEKR